MSFGGYDLPAGVKVAPCIYLVHRRPDVYPEPERFLPERFLDEAPGTYTWIPFGGGVRRCLGGAFAQLEMEVVLRELVSTRGGPAGTRRAGARPPARDHRDAAPRRRGGRLLNRREKQAETRSVAAALGRASVLPRRDSTARRSTRSRHDAGYTKGAFYANFGSKEELFLVMLDERFAAEIERLDHRLAGAGGARRGGSPRDPGLRPLDRPGSRSGASSTSSSSPTRPGTSRSAGSSPRGIGRSGDEPPRC